VLQILLRIFVFILLGLALTACRHTPVTLTLYEALGIGKQVDTISLNPNLRYLRVTFKGRVILLVLGYKEPHVLGPIETWYSAEGEVLRMQNGRILSTTGLEVDWRAVRHKEQPSWAHLLEHNNLQFKREIDEMPGYRFGIEQRLSLYQIPTPNNALLKGLPPSDLRWFEEKVLDQNHGLPSARYGLQMEDGQPTVVYADQCLSKDFCFTWQIWPLTP
jgi:hypothetical protein